MAEPTLNPFSQATACEACIAGKYSADGDDTSCTNNCGTLVGAATTTCTTGTDQVAATCNAGYGLSGDACVVYYIDVSIDQVGGSPDMPDDNGPYLPFMIPNAIPLRVWPYANRQNNPSATVLKILSAYTPAQVEDNCLGACFDINIKDNDGAADGLFSLQEIGPGWELIFWGSSSNGDSEGYARNNWAVTLEVSLNSGSVVPPREIIVQVMAPPNELGCIDATAFNHNPNANTDDSTCKFCFQVLNADVYTCDAIGASGIQSVTCSSGYLETGLAGDNLGCTECPDTGVQCCQNAALHATSTTCSGGGYNDHITSVTCDTGYSESGSVAGGDLGCLNCATNYFLSQGLCHSCTTTEGITCNGAALTYCPTDNVLLGGACHTCSVTKAAYQDATCSCSN